jgi:hypothetical protein
MRRDESTCDNDSMRQLAAKDNDGLRENAFALPIIAGVESALSLFD